jgi:hypothetical protein
MHARKIFPSFTSLTQVCMFVLSNYRTAFQLANTEDIKYPDPEPNTVKRTTQFARKSSTGPSTQDQPEHPKFSPSETHRDGASHLQNSTPAASGHPASQQITHERSRGPNGWLLATLKGLKGKPRHVPEDDVSEGSTVYDEKFAEPCSSSEGENTRLELEQQLSVVLAVQTEQDYQITRLTDELAKKSALLDESLLSRDQQIGQYEKELANVRAKLEAKESELEAVRLRLASAEKGLTKNKE